MRLERHLPWALPALLAAGILVSLRMPRAKGADLQGFGRLPVLQGGRVKPLDTIAGSSLLMLRGKRSVTADGRRIGAAQWMLDVMARPETADVYKIFAIDEPDLRGMLGRAPSEDKYFSFMELEPHAREIAAQAEQAERLEAGQRSRFQSAAVNLHERLDLYQRLQNTLQVSGTRDMPEEIKGLRKALPAGLAALRAHMDPASGRGRRSYDRKALETLTVYFERYRFLSEAAYFRPLPPLEGERPEDWSDMGTGLLETLRGGAVHPAAQSYAHLLAAYRRSDAAAFDKALADYRSRLQARLPRTWARSGYEAFFNRAEPFYQGMLLYLAALLGAFASWIVWPKPLGKASFRVLVLAFLVHTAGLVFRIFLQGRPPVTNLYSSAVFVGWAAVLLGIVAERVSRRGFATAAASAVGFSTLIIAHHLAGQGDTLEMMRAVLDSNFWLATHVVTITIGYAATFLAAMLAHIYIFRGLLTPSLDKETAKSLAQMTYGMVCFAIFFSFVGTVLGGIWADQSWGRFWGWDPKENGALLIVLWNAIILHAHWGGLVRERGLMVMAVLGAIVTSLSWFGVNMLGIGLHSYGFMDKAFYALAGFVLFELGVAAAGSLPLSRWVSFSGSLPLRPPSPSAR